MVREERQREKQRKSERDLANFGKLLLATKDMQERTRGGRTGGNIIIIRVNHREQTVRPVSDNVSEFNPKEKRKN